MKQDTWQHSPAYWRAVMCIRFFVPPVYDLLQPQGFFKIEEEQISQINTRIGLLEEDEEYKRQVQQLAALRQTAQETLEEAKRQMKRAKEKREERRREAALPNGAPMTPEEESALIRESQFQKAEYKRMERAWKERIAPLQQTVSDYEAGIQALKSERKQRSAALQQNCSNNSNAELSGRSQDALRHLRADRTQNPACGSR